MPRALRSAPLALVLAVAAAGYLSSLATTVLGHDHGEYVTTGSEGGAPHPPGYPLYVLWLRLWSWLPAGAVTRTSLASAALGLAAAAVLHAAARRWRASPPAAALAAALFALSPRVWSLHTHADNLALGGLLGALVLWTAAAPLPPLRRAAALGLLAGAGVCNHHTLFALTPVGLWGLARAWAAARRPPLAASPPAVGPARVLGAAALGLAVGLVPYAYPLYLAHAADGRWVWGDLRGVGDLVPYILRAEYGSGRLTAQLDAATVGPGGQLAALAGRLGRDLLWLPALLGVAMAALALARGAVDRRRRGLAAVALSFVLAGPALMAVNQTPPQALGGLLVGRLDAIAELTLCLLVARGVDEAARRLPAPAGAARWALPALALLSAPRAWSEAREAHRPTVQLYLGNLLDTLPPGAVVLGGNELHLFGLLYLQRIERQRPDVLHLSPTMLFRPWYRARAERALGRPLVGVTSDGLLMVRMVGDMMASGRPVFVLDADANYEPVLDAFPNHPEGVAIRLLPPGTPPPATADLEARQSALFARYRLEPAPPRPRTFGARVYQDYARPWDFLAAEYEEQRRPADAARMHDRAAAFAPR